jgi:uncharacterized protein (TIGR03437 family)
MFHLHEARRVPKSQTRRRAVTILVLAACAAWPIALWADLNGADQRLTAAPGDDQAACTSCHLGTALNGGAGNVKIVLPGDATYTPGVKQRISVQVSDPAQRRWGFELTARLVSNLSSGQAGDLASADSNTRVICDNGRSKPCNSAATVQFITHTQAGTRLGTTGSVSFDFDWTPPSTDAGNVRLYAAGNAANGNGANTGDHIYTTSVELKPASSTPRPAITSTNGVVNAASFQPGIMQNGWVTITGANLAATTRTWTSDELASGKLPTSLDGVSVTIDGKAAYVEYVSPAQLNVVAPADDSVGPVNVVVTVNGQSSDPVTATLQSFSPAFFAYDGKYLAATHADNSLLGKQGLFAAAPDVTTPAKPGETIVLYGTGFGPADGAAASGQLTSAVANITTPLTVTIGGTPAAVLFSGLIPPFAALYQFNVQVPQSLAAGDQAVVVQIGGVTSRNDSTCCFITVQP